MLEPITAFGISMGILNIILNTIPSLEQKYYDIFELGKLLVKFSRTLDLYMFRKFDGMELRLGAGRDDGRNVSRPPWSGRTQSN